ncbi:hypothetical protein J6590_051293 [Homalodisca vitripennis]|nr:hypothetical protein J6590_051293 [Homalodisca vitripennis]
MLNSPSGDLQQSRRALIEYERHDNSDKSTSVGVQWTTRRPASWETIDEGSYRVGGRWAFAGVWGVRPARHHGLIRSLTRISCMDNIRHG